MSFTVTPTIRENVLFCCLLLGFLVLVDKAGVRNIDTVQELTDILVADKSGLVDQSGGSRNELQVSSLDDDFVLLILRLSDCAPVEHVQRSDNLLSKEVSDLDGLALVDDVRVDGKVSISESKLMDISLLDTSEHVLNVRNDGSDRRSWDGSTEPHLASNLSAELE